MNLHQIRVSVILGVSLCATIVVGRATLAAPPGPVLETVFPAGAAAGRTVEVAVSGSNLNGLKTLHGNVPGLKCERLDESRLQITIPPESPPGLYELWAVCENGVSSQRTFAISHLPEEVEVEPNDSLSTSHLSPLNAVINGRIDKGGDVDHFRFEAKRGQRVILECSAERIDSRLRAVLEVFDAAGRRLAANRGYFGIDPLVDFHVPADGAYVVKVQDLIHSGGPQHYYRLEIDAGPRVVFSMPGAVQFGKASRVTLYGWNLAGADERADSRGEPAATAGHPLAPGAHEPWPFDRMEIEIPEAMAKPSWPLLARLQPAQAAFEGFGYHLPGSHTSVLIGVTDLPVVTDCFDNHSPASALGLTYPCEVCGQLADDDERDWFSIQAQRGEVLYIESLAQRIGSPVDLQVSVLDASGIVELTQFGDEIRNVGGQVFPTSHLDPVGRWVVPADGRYLIAIRNLIGGLMTDPRRTYRLSIRREEPRFDLVVVPRGESPSGVNVPRGGRELLEVLVLRSRGMTGPIRISARDLPAGVECPEVWLGPGVDRGALVVTANQTATAEWGALQIEGIAEQAGRRTARGAAVVRSGLPSGWGRITSQIPLAVTGDAPLRITADGHQPLDHHLYGRLQVRHSPGGILDVAVTIDRKDTTHQAPVKLIGVALPEQIRNETAIIPAGMQKGYLSFFLPPELPVGTYTIVVRAETTIPTSDGKTEPVAAYSNPVTFEVVPEAFILQVDPFAPTRARRGETIQISYSADRRNGFIGKIHTELAAPGRVTDVVGLRARGETFVGQTDKGSLQIVINEDAPLGRLQFLRLYGVGVREDEPIFHGSRFVTLEIIE